VATLAAVGCSSMDVEAQENAMRVLVLAGEDMSLRAKVSRRHVAGGATLSLVSPRVTASRPPSHRASRTDGSGGVLAARLCASRHQSAAGTVLRHCPADLAAPPLPHQNTALCTDRHTSAKLRLYAVSLAARFMWAPEANYPLFARGAITALAQQAQVRVAPWLAGGAACATEARACCRRAMSPCAASRSTLCAGCATTSPNSCRSSLR
jgi:hypothetical protein